MRCERWRKPLTATNPNDDTMNMPPVSMPVSPELVISIMTMALAVPNNGTNDVSSVLTPSLVQARVVPAIRFFLLEVWDLRACCFVVPQ